MARRSGTYTEVIGLLRDANGAVTGVKLREAGQGSVQELRAKVVVNCGGPWAEKLAHWAGGGVRLRPGKGVHLIYEKRLTNFAVTLDAVDGRQIFIMPYQNETWIGTTDDDYYGDLDDLWATQDEIQYLREAVERVLPQVKHQRLIGTRVGVRNTIHGYGQPEDDLSRRSEVIDHARHGAPGLFSIAGVSSRASAFRARRPQIGFASASGLRALRDPSAHAAWGR